MRRNLSDLNNKIFDLIIIGGGIHGAALAWRASRQGLSVCLIEKNDFAEGASANSQKIIHGGLRYLQSMNFKRIFQSISERKRLMWLAPHLVHPLSCVMPVYGFGLKGKETVGIGLRLYNLLSGNRNDLIDPSKNISVSELCSLDKLNEWLPDLNLKGVRGGACWQDALCFNTERMVISFLKSAYAHGAVIINYLEAKSLIISKNKIKGIKAHDKLNGVDFEIYAKSVINCCGPWYSSIFPHYKDGARNMPGHWILGVNLIVKRLFNHEYAVGIPNQDGIRSRLYFVVPWRGKSILGTDWYPYTENPDNLTCPEDACLCLIENFNKAYPAAHLSPEDISFVHFGLVPPKCNSIDRTDTLDKFHIFDHKYHGIYGFYAVLGVKYTTAVHVAEKVLEKLSSKNLKLKLPDQPRLKGGEIESFLEYQEQMKRNYKNQFPNTRLNNLVLNYGTEAEEILKKAVNYNESSLISTNSQKLLAAELEFVINNEMPYHLTDILLRRTGMGSLGPPSEKEIQFVSSIVAAELKWDDKRKKKEINQFKNNYPEFIRKRVYN